MNSGRTTFPSSRLLPFAAVLCSVALGGCGAFANLGGAKKVSPDEFKIVSHSPLTMPPNAELRPPPGHTGSVEVPLVIKRALGKGLSIDPGERFPSLDALIAALTEALLPDAETQSIHRNKILLGAATTLSLALTTASVLWVYHDGKRSDLRINMQMAWVFASCIFVTIAFFRKKILAQPRFRRVSQLILLLGGYLVVGRTIGVTQGYTAGPFLIQEMVGIALLFLAEVPAVGFRYLILPLLCLVSIALQIRFPEWRRIHLNIAYGVMTFLGAYWHLKGTPPEPR